MRSVMKKNLKVKGKTRGSVTELFPIGSLCIHVELENIKEECFNVGSLWVNKKHSEDDWYCIMILENVSAFRVRVLIEDGSSMLWNLSTLEAYFVKTNSAVSEENK